jgi:ATP-dependent Clp protease ATP-binding subunit ClpC
MFRFVGDRDRFDKFTDRAKNVLSLAQEEAQRMWPTPIGSEHILLGLLREGEDVGARILQNMGMELASAREAVKAMAAQNEPWHPGEIGLNDEGRKVIEQAVDEARRLNHHYVGTEHILLALVGMPESAVARVLREMEITGEEIRTYTIEILSQVA